MQFVKGQSGNLKGRPRLKTLSIRDMVARDGIKVYKLLWKSIQNSEPWAIDIFFRHFISNDMLINEILHHDQDHILDEISNLS
jgi:hypothetical protein